jgi:hypothetical protein
LCSRKSRPRSSYSLFSLWRRSCKTDEEEVVILGRGKSLEKLSEFNTKIKKVILINEFWETTPEDIPYYKDPVIHKFIEDKELIVLCNPGVTTKFIKPFLKRYRIKTRYQSAFNRTLRVAKPKNYFKNLPDEIIDPFCHLLENWPKVGQLGVAVLLCKYTYNIKTFHIFGLDFYEHDYYRGVADQFVPENRESIRLATIPYEICQMIDAWMNFARYHDDCQFNIHTFATLRSEGNIYVQP